jgi:4-amino-4-deoxy-L-arabinose transferase-like glycosyltransferase
MTSLSLRRRSAVFGTARSRIRRPNISVEARWIWLAVLLFIAMSVWWLTQDTRIPDWDSGAHEYHAIEAHSQLAAGQLSLPFTNFNTYPPLVHIIGGLSIFLAGIHPMSLILSSNLVFVPLLAFGCFGVGRIAYGPRAGLLAAVVALGSPMFVSMMHEYDLDPPQAALIAVSVWAILASRRFERVGISALAGALAGLAMLTKETSVVFLAGLLAVVLIRGGWRNWLGLIVFLFVLENIAGGWYVYHWQGIRSTFDTIGGQAGLAVSSLQTPSRFTIRNFSWYWWNLANEQVMAPFAISFVIGGALAAWRVVRRRITAENVEPELLGGAIVSYVVMTYLTHKDPRYTLPMLVYVAVLGTGWIATLKRPRLRTGLSAAVVGLSIIYFVGMSLGIGGSVRIAFPGSYNTIIYSRQLTLYETSGWVRGGPVHDGDVNSLLAGLHRSGIRGVIFETGPNPIDFNTSGLTIMAISQGLGYNNDPPYPASEEAYLILRPPKARGPAPCQKMNDGSGIYVVRGPAPGLDPPSLRDPKNPRQRYTLLCPGRPPQLYP